MPLYALDDAAPDVPGDGRYWVAPDARVIGRVTLGEDVNIWFAAILRGDNEPMHIGARSNIQDGAVLHSDTGFPLTVGEDCTVGHSVILHGCTIGAGSLIGMGATILNGARIGKGSLVGANALVTEGKVFPDHSLIVGSPARVVRTLEPADAERLLSGAAHYVENARRFAKGLRQVG
ncbi:gamma carbonic anhydrase family protein [Labrys monachus]|uniref:Carbonic anhydrase/acetyltransferase-like protein (Isoleucine patch superfamily) n=1 Tax=Labrys monachus TaxID=217067 RepID=A0ABU0FH34_9HYPH|nr:gamma carbonic anhydrase family protein [Labrys monachus]MDQ0393928.1 carbonic anhydrase/acetyltransferase-like protein (isoleucine patch superfamily) [Labrys monachus]